MIRLAMGRLSPITPHRQAAYLARNPEFAEEQRSMMQEAGDPFSLRVPRRLRKMKIGRAIGGAFRRVAGFLPIPGASVIANLFQQARDAGVPEERIQMAQEFARSYGLDVGDPGPKPKPLSKRKTAGAGPKAKAAKKRQKRSKKKLTAADLSGGPPPSMAGMPSMGAIGTALGAASSGADLTGKLAAILGGGKGGKGGLALGGRRHMNPANVHALRRSLRRVEGFERLARRVMPALFYAKRHGRSGRAAAAGHKKGCRCVVCTRAA